MFKLRSLLQNGLVFIAFFLLLNSPIRASETLSPKTTGISVTERGIHFKGVVLMEANASDADLKQAIARQVKTALGALQILNIGLNDRDARINMKPETWERTIVKVLGPDGSLQNATIMQQVEYSYNDKAVVSDQLLQSSSVSFVLLAGNYLPKLELLKQNCSNDPYDATNSLWYHFTPTQPSCKKLISKEIDAIARERRVLNSAPDVIGPIEATRTFIPITASLDSPVLPVREFYPEYDRLFGFDSDRERLVVYVFLGADSNSRSLDDSLGKEAMLFYRTLLDKIPNLQVTDTAPGTMLLDLYVNGKKLENITYRQMFSWLIDDTAFPAEIGQDEAQRRYLRQQAIEKFAERRITWETPMEIFSSDGRLKKLTLEIRSFYGLDDGDSEIRERAKNRYLEAFWYGDVIIYSGHSHFGNGLLEPQLYGPGNFPERYQILLINSCLSYNYYNRDFLEIKPGGTRNIDTVVNGLPSYIYGGGISTARFLTSLLSSTPKSYKQILRDMQIDLPWGVSRYDPMRVADGELDNLYSPETMSLKVIFP